MGRNRCAEFVVPFGAMNSREDCRSPRQPGARVDNRQRARLRLLRRGASGSAGNDLRALAGRHRGIDPCDAWGGHFQGPTPGIHDGYRRSFESSSGRSFSSWGSSITGPGRAGSGSSLRTGVLGGLSPGLSCSAIGPGRGSGTISSFTLHLPGQYCPCTLVTRGTGRRPEPLPPLCRTERRSGGRSLDGNIPAGIVQSISRPYIRPAR